MSDKGKGLRERKEVGRIREPISIAFNPTKHRIRHIVHLAGGHTNSVTAVAVTPDGRRLVTGSGDKTAKLWDIETGRCLQTFIGHAGWVNAVAVTPDGSKIITASNDHTVKFWDLERGELLVTMYNIDEGFLWTTPPTKNAPSGWLWTDREDFISVLERDKDDGGNPVPLPPDDPNRKNYLGWVNDQKMVMSRLDLSWEEIQALEDERDKILKLRRDRRTLTKKLPRPDNERS